MADQAVARRHPIRGRSGHERVVPGETGGRLYMEHLGRYEFASQFVRGRRVLDVACGAGYGAPVICGSGALSYLGVDISPEAVGVAESRYRISEKVSFSLGDACRLEGIGPAAFDVAVSFETIEHVQQPEHFLARIVDVLVPGGRFIISTPNRTAYDPCAGPGAAPANPFHVQEWTVEEFVRLLKRFFRVEETLGQGPYPLWKIVGRRLAAAFRPLGWAADCYLATKPVLKGIASSPSTSEAPVPVRRIEAGLWRRPTYVVCVCSPLHRALG